MQDYITQTAIVVVNLIFLEASRQLGRKQQEQLKLTALVIAKIIILDLMNTQLMKRL